MIHPQTKQFIRLMFTELAAAPDRRAEKAVFRRARAIYRQAWDEARIPAEPASVPVYAVEKWTLGRAQANFQVQASSVVW